MPLTLKIAVGLISFRVIITLFFIGFLFYNYIINDMPINLNIPETIKTFISDNQITNYTPIALGLIFIPLIFQLTALISIFRHKYYSTTSFLFLSLLILLLTNWPIITFIAFLLAISNSSRRYFKSKEKTPNIGVLD